MALRLLAFRVGQRGQPEPFHVTGSPGCSLQRYALAGCVLVTSGGAAQTIAYLLHSGQPVLLPPGMGHVVSSGRLQSGRWLSLFGLAVIGSSLSWVAVFGPCQPRRRSSP